MKIWSLSSCDIKTCKKDSDLNWIRSHDLCDTGVQLHQSSYQANWELTTLWVRNIPTEGDQVKNTNLSLSEFFPLRFMAQARLREASGP